MSEEEDAVSNLQDALAREIKLRKSLEVEAKRLRSALYLAEDVVEGWHGTDSPEFNTMIENLDIAIEEWRKMKGGADGVEEASH